MKENVIEFIEDVTAKKLIMKPFVKAYLKRQQYLAFITQKYQLLSLFNKLILLAITASIAILLVL